MRQHSSRVHRASQAAVQAAAAPPLRTDMPAARAIQHLQHRAADSPQSQAAAALQRRADMAVQRAGGLEEEEPLQGKLVQRAGGLEEEEPLQGKGTMPVQRESSAPARSGGLPADLQSGLESLSGHDMSDVRVHYNSPAPAQVGALAYTQGTDIHVAPGQEQHLPHEAWHTVQQRQGRVAPTGSVAGLPLNDDTGLEHEADVMGARSASEGVRQHRLARDSEG